MCVCVCVCVVIDTAKFGKVAYVSVGAHMVASIQFTMPESAKGNKGDDYGYFQVSLALPMPIYGYPGLSPSLPPRLLPGLSVYPQSHAVQKWAFSGSSFIPPPC
jgi:hypothetical protein